MLDTNWTPEKFIWKNCTNPEDYCAIATPKTNGKTFIIDESLHIREVEPGVVVLPKAELNIHVKDVSIENVDQKYDEYTIRMKEERFKLLNKLKQDVGSGIYYYFSFMSQPCDIGGLVFIEGFSAVWAEGRIISKLDTLFTVH